MHRPNSVHQELSAAKNENKHLREANSALREDISVLRTEIVAVSKERDRNANKERALNIVLAVGSSVLGWGTSLNLPIAIRVPCCYFSLACFLWLLRENSTYFRAGWKRITVASIFSVVAFAALTTHYFYGAWMFEKAATLEGDLSTDHWEKSSALPTFQIGPGGATEFAYTGVDSDKKDAVTIMKDAGLKIYRGKKGLVISTKIRDRNGNIVVEISDNHWRVFPPYCSEKNFTKNALEVKDNRDWPVLQIYMYPDRIMLQGEWQNEFGNGIEIFLPPQSSSKNGEFIFWNDLAQRAIHEERIPEMFTYPSSRHLGELKAQ